MDSQEREDFAEVPAAFRLAKNRNLGAIVMSTRRQQR